MYKKKVLIGIFLITILAFSIMGLIKINIINTKALSPMGTSNNNYEMVKEEFGEDFSNFIRDNAPVKIYVNEDNTLVRIKDKDYKIKEESKILTAIRNFINKIGDNK